MYPGVYSGLDLTCSSRSFSSLVASGPVNRPLWSAALEPLGCWPGVGSSRQPHSDSSPWPLHCT